MQENRSAPSATVVPILIYEDVAHAVDWLCSAFGFADGHFEQAKQFGAKVVEPPTDMPFGERQYTVEDYGGHWWTFSQHVADVCARGLGCKGVTGITVHQLRRVMCKRGSAEEGGVSGRV